MMNLHRCEYLVRQRDEYTILQIMITFNVDKTMPETTPQSSP